MNNRVLMGKDGFLTVILKGTQTESSIKKIIKETQSFIEELRKEGKYVKILADLRGMGRPDSAARRVGTEFEKTGDFDKIALFGSSAYTKYVVNFSIMASGNRVKIRYFQNLIAARAWLKA